MNSQRNWGLETIISRFLVAILRFSSRNSRKTIRMALVRTSRTGPRIILTPIADVVVEATGSAKILEDAIHYVRRGGKLVVYGVYSSSAKVSWPPSKIFGDEITILGSFSETFMFRKYIPRLCPPGIH